MYTGLSRDEHRILKFYCVATDESIKNFQHSANTHEMASRPGMPEVRSLVETVRAAITQASPAEQLK
jgi:hypothetical protein